MNGLRYLISLCLVIFAVIIGLHGITASEDQKKEDMVLRTTDVVETFYQEGIKMNLALELSPVDFVINEKMPIIYEFPGSREKLFLYEYPTIEKRNEALAGIYNEGALEKTKGFLKLQEEKECLLNSIRAKNILLIYVIEYDSKVVKELKDLASLDKFTRTFAPNMQNVERISFLDLNDGLTVNYQGSGQFWEGKVALRYYQHFWEDEAGQNRYESWSNENFQLKYLGSDSDKPEEIICSYDGPAGSGQGVFEYTDFSLDQDGYLNLGSSGGNGVVNVNGEYCMTIRWGEKWEIFQLEKI